MTLLGVDLGTRKVSVAVFTEGDQGSRLYLAETHVALEGIARGYQLLELARFVHDKAVFFEADAIWIEDVIIGNNRKYSLQLAQVLGAVGAELARGRTGDAVWTVDNKVWKKELVGNGNATKEDVQNYIVATHPDYALLCGDDQDCFDATCIGLYGLRITARSRDLHLTSE